MRTFIAIAVAVQLLAASSVFAGQAAAPAVASTAVGASASARGLSAFAQSKGPRPATVSGAVSQKLLSEYAKPQGLATKAGTAAGEFSGFIPGKNPALSGLAGQAQNNAVLLGGLAAVRN